MRQACAPLMLTDADIQAKPASHTLYDDTPVHSSRCCARDLDLRALELVEQRLGKVRSRHPDRAPSAHCARKDSIGGCRNAELDR
jgi:hypothetical protein